MLETVFAHTFSGHLFNCVAVDRNQIDVVDIAHHLSMQCRFNGATRKFYSVAEHCYLGSFMVPEEAAFPFLLHDASEAYLGDIIHPLKVKLPAYSDYEDHLQSILEEHFGIDGQSDEMRDIVHRCDKWLGRQEARSLVHNSKDRSGFPVADFKPRIIPDWELMGWAQKDAKYYFLKRFAELQEQWQGTKAA